MSDVRPPPAAADELAHAFLTLLPIVRATARARFHHWRCADGREDRVCETVALAWLWFVRLRARGRDPAAFPVAFARLAARAVASGRRLAGQDRTGDALAWRTRRRHGFEVGPLPAVAPAPGSELADALADNTQSPVVSQVEFRLDFPAWKRRLSGRERRVVDQLVLGHRTRDVAAMFRVSAARISQLRREFHEDYLAFLADRPAR